MGTTEGDYLRGLLETMKTRRDETGPAPRDRLSGKAGVWHWCYTALRDAMAAEQSGEPGAKGPWWMTPGKDT